MATSFTGRLYLTLCICKPTCPKEAMKGCLFAYGHRSVYLASLPPVYCADGCGQVVAYGKKYIRGHYHNLEFLTPEQRRNGRLRAAETLKGRCKICGRKFKNLPMHMYHSHNDSPKPNIIGNCPQCGKYVKSIPLHVYHQHTEEGQKFSKKMGKFISTNFSGNIRFKYSNCPICGKRTKNVGGHVFLAHGGQSYETRAANARKHLGYNNIPSEEGKRQMIKKRTRTIKRRYPDGTPNNFFRRAWADPVLRDETFFTPKHRKAISEGAKRRAEETGQIFEISGGLHRVRHGNHWHKSKPEKRICPVVKQIIESMGYRFGVNLKIGRREFDFYAALDDEVIFIVEYHWPQARFNETLIKYANFRFKLMQILDLNCPLVVCHWAKHKLKCIVRGSDNKSLVVFDPLLLKKAGFR